MTPKKATQFAALAAATGLLLTGCAGDSAPGGGSVIPDGQELGIVGVEADIADITEYCGDEPVKVAYADGAGNNAWRAITRAIFEEWAAKCDNITDVIYTDAQGDTQKAISDINSLVSQGVDVIVSFVDGGEALLPTVRQATQQGVSFVPLVGSPGGEPGVDYVDFVSEDIVTYGEGLARWTLEQMGGTGNLVMLGGGAGNSYSQNVYEGVLRALEDYPDVTLLNEDGFVVTDWEPGKIQQVVAGLITAHGQIDGIVSDYGGGSVGGIRAFLAAEKDIPVWSANDSNEFACLWDEYGSEDSKYQIATMSSRNWVIRAALNKGLAAHNGIVNTDPSTFNLEIIEDSTDPALQPTCEPSLPADAILSSGLSVESMQELFN
ncbi:substrate-binding domain-containing protein [Leucobacter weissii]|uniref:Substrate-binding domain-containing protein n=1 Tax=Leucobacter weissii TaxID=1983706 RepID=A0A939MMU5_9MICO|nr:substrate-binding domain-containing protein [Leucobacter weissii]MBO1901492.1 substrate-binding domain-containing protein [Leucobacter weissii]